MGMGKDLYENFPVAREMFDQAEAHLGFPIKKICFEGPEEALIETKNQQLAIVIVSAACFALIKESTVPQCCAGLSLGEYSAVWAAGCISFHDLLTLVQERSAAMQEAAMRSPSTMIAVIDVSLDKIAEVCKSVGNCYIANVNSPAQAVVSLSKDAVDSFTAGISRLGVGKAVVLNVSGGFHSPFMQSAEARLKSALTKVAFKDARIPIVSNIDACVYTHKDQIRENLLKQLTGRVLWKDSVLKMLEKTSIFYEIGPSRILKGLLRKFNAKTEVTTFGKREEIEQLQNQSKESIKNGGTNAV